MNHLSDQAAAPSVRVLGRVDNWWYSKVAPALAISFCSVVLFRVAPWPAARSIVLIAFVGLCAGAYGHIVNDVFDIEVDLRAGKRNHMARFNPTQRFLFCAATLALGFAPALFVSFSRTSLLLLAIEFLLPTIYSVPPLRLKGRGALGLLCDSFGAHLIPCLYCISVLAHEAPNPALLHTLTATLFVAFTAVWALSLGLIGILIHEFEDRANDLRSGIRTFATETSFARLRNPMTALYAVELCAFAGIALTIARPAPVVALAAAVFLLTLAIKLSAHWPHYRHYEDDATAIQWWQLTHPFYEAWLPIAASLQCAILHPALALFPILLFALFWPTFRKQSTELTDVFRHASAWLLFGGRLHVDPTAGASIWPYPLPRLGTRLHITHPGSEPPSDHWSVRLLRPNLALHAGLPYQIRFRIRADRPRTITFGVWQDHAPWQSLGHVEQLPITPAWQTIWRTFPALHDDPHATFGFWLGGEPGSIDLWRCSIRPATPEDSVG